MKITLELTGAPADLRWFIAEGLAATAVRQLRSGCDELAGEVLEAAVKDGAAGITLDAGHVRLTAPAQNHWPAIGVLGAVEDEVVHLNT